MKLVPSTCVAKMNILSRVRGAAQSAPLSYPASFDFDSLRGVSGGKRR